tara:strand:- start:2608 stop:3783 length:1176 start_codon:yes stop_codon:yes gene_type:complete
MKKLISILGSTGSVGLSTLEIISKKKNFFKPFLFSANKNYKLICNQINKFKPTYFVINDKKTFNQVSNKFKNKKVKILNDYDNINSNISSCITISAIPGLAGLEPILKSMKFSKKILLANKEAIICGWDLIKKKASQNKTKIVPVDSEHYSILKLIENQKIDSIKKIYITASGGPFLNFKPHQLKKVKLNQALRHPKWKMGKKITIDSSNLMNKIFEIVEAQKIFNIPFHKIDIIIHPNSLVHAILDLKNGIKKFIYHETSMKIPLANAIFDGELNINNFFKEKKTFGFENLIFEKVNKKIFPNIMLKNKINQFPASAIIINASNEVLVEHFLEKKIAFLDINKIIMTILKDGNFKKYAVKKPNSIKQIYQINNWAKSVTIKKIKNLCTNF